MHNVGKGFFVIRSHGRSRSASMQSERGYLYSSTNTVSIDSVSGQCSIGADQSARMRRLIRACVV